jgi:hypothetical protein
MKKFFTCLFKLQREMKSLMHTVSGTHNNNPMGFVDNAKKNVKNGSVHHLSLDYFYVKCEEFPHVSNEFATSLPNKIKGSSNKKPPRKIVMSTPRGCSIAMTSSLSKKSSNNNFSEASVQAFKDIAESMKEKHSTDKMFQLLAMDCVSPDTKNALQNTLLEDF